MDDLVGDMPTGRSPVRLPTIARSVVGIDEHHATGERPRRRVRAPRPCRPRRSRRSTSVTPAGSSDLPPLDQRPSGPVVDRDRARRPGWRSRSTACAPAAGGRCASNVVPTTSPATASTSTSGAIGARRSRCARPTTTPSAPRRASTPCRRCRGRCRRRRRRPRAAGRRHRPGDQRRRSESMRGSAVYRPRVSVSSTSRSAPTLCATSAAMRSLSP